MYYQIVLLILTIILISYFIRKKEHFISYTTQNINSLHKYFDLIYVITLPKRKSYIKNIMDDLGIKPIYFDAKLKQNLNIKKLIDDNFIIPNYNKNSGKIACHLSHISALKDFLKTNKQRCFIFEDDLKNVNIPIKKFNKTVNQIMDALPNSFDIIYFGRCWDKCYKQKYITKNLVKSYFPQCRHAYGITRKGALKIIKNSIPLISSGDYQIAKLAEAGILEAYAVTPGLFFQNRAEIGSELNNTDSMKECDPRYKLKSKSI